MERAVPYCVNFNRFSERANRYNRDLTNQGYRKFKKDTIAFDGTDCNKKLFEWWCYIKGRTSEGKKSDCLGKNTVNSSKW